MTLPRITRPPSRIGRLLVPERATDLTLTGLALGANREMLCYWLGMQVQDESEGRTRAIVTTVVFPQIESDYSSFRLREGQMACINAWCAAKGVWVLAQVHTHPTDEPHSEADECWPVSHRTGFLSVVIPFFAQMSSTRDPLWRLHELDDDGSWSEADPEGRLEIIKDVWLPGT